MANSINWFEIPAADYDRAHRFYSTLMAQELATNEMMGTKMGFFPHGEREVGGAICFGEGYEPSASGATVYLNAGDDLSEMLGRVDGAGGKVVLPKTQVSEEVGFIAMFMDSEGNKVALHSMG